MSDETLSSERVIPICAACGGSMRAVVDLRHRCASPDERPYCVRCEHPICQDNHGIWRREASGSGECPRNPARDGHEPRTRAGGEGQHEDATCADCGSLMVDDHGSGHLCPACDQHDDCDGFPCSGTHRVSDPCVLNKPLGSGTFNPCARCGHSSSLHPAVLGGTPGCSGDQGKCGCHLFLRPGSQGGESA